MQQALLAPSVRSASLARILQRTDDDDEQEVQERGRVTEARSYGRCPLRTRYITDTPPAAARHRGRRMLPGVVGRGAARRGGAGVEGRPLPVRPACPPPLIEPPELLTQSRLMTP